MGEDRIVPAVQGHQPVERRQIDPCLPFRLADLAAQGRDARD